MAITIAKNSTFTHLNGNRSFKVKDTSSSRERSMIVDITYDSAQNYVTGGNTLDFSKLGFSQVYYCNILAKSYVPEMSFVVGASNSAALGKLKIWDVTGAELSNASTATHSMTVTVEIRGI